MNLHKIRLFTFEQPFLFPYSSPHTSRTTAESVIVQLVFDDGIYGFGESAPRDYVTGETCASVHQLIRDVFSPILLGRTLSRLEDIQEILDLLEQECAQKDISSYSSALGAIDLSLLDALGKFQGYPVTHYLGAVQKKKVPYSISMPLVPLEKIEVLFSKYRNLRFDHLKILVGQDEAENVKRVALMRRLLGERFDIRLEANGKWTFSQAISHLEKLTHYGISAVEEPLAPGDIQGLQEIKKRFKVRLIVDESVRTLSEARAMIDAGVCDILNIKISKCGGILKSRAIAEFSASLGVACSLGCHVGESEILRSAGRHFAAVTSGLKFVEGYSDLLFHGHAYSEKEPRRVASMEKKRVFPGLGFDPAGPPLPEEWLVPLGAVTP